MIDVRTSGASDFSTPLKYAICNPDCVLRIPFLPEKEGLQEEVLVNLDQICCTQSVSAFSKTSHPPELQRLFCGESLAININHTVFQ